MFRLRDALEMPKHNDTHEITVTVISLELIPEIHLGFHLSHH